MIIKIEIDTREALSDEDRAILRAVAFMDEEGPAPAASQPAASKPAAKKAAAKKAAAPSPEPEAASEPGDGPSSPGDGTALRDAAIARTADLLSSGGRDRVMAALQRVGSPKASEVSPDRLQEYLDLLADDDS